MNKKNYLNSINDSKKPFIIYKTKKGFDLELTSKISESVSIPVVASGGVGSKKHFLDGVKLGKASALLAASVFHFKEITIREVKNYLESNSINVRLDNFG